MPYVQPVLSRVEKALDRLGLLKRSCAFIRAKTGMDVPGIFDPGFNRWISKLEKLESYKRYNKRQLKTRMKDKATLASIYYKAYKKSKSGKTIAQLEADGIKIVKDGFITIDKPEDIIADIAEVYLVQF